MKTKFSPTALTSSLLKALKAEGFTITPPEDKTEADIKKDFMTAMGKVCEDMEKEKPTGTGKKVRVVGADGKVVEMELAAPKKKAKAEEEKEEEEEEETETETETETDTDKKDKGQNAAIKKLAEGQTSIAKTLEKIMSGKAGSQFNTDKGGEDEEPSFMDILTGKAKAKGTGSKGSTGNKTLDRQAGIIAKRLKSKGFIFAGEEE